MVSDGVHNSHFVTKVGKEKPEDSNTAHQVFLPTWLFCLSYLPGSQKGKLRTNLEKFLHHGSCNLPVMVPQTYTLGN